MSLDDTFKCTRHIKLGGMWSMENQLLCLSYINAHFILLGPIRWRYFGDTTTSKGQIAYFYCACAKRPYLYFRSKIWRQHRIRRPQFPVRCRNLGDSATSKGQIAYFSLRMRETVIFLLPVKNLTSPSCSPTPISYKAREFWRYLNIKGRYCVFHICMDLQDFWVKNGDFQG